MKNSQPFISVVIPAYNEEKFIGPTLEALNNQAYPRSKMEIIVVDNNSIDSTVEIANRLADKVLHYHDKPVGKVRNFGVAHAQGEVLFFIDADCVAPSDWVENGVRLIKEQNDRVLGGGITLRKNPTFIEKYWLLQGRNHEVLPKELLGASIAVNKSAFFKVNGFSETLTAGEDSKFHQDLIEKGYNVQLYHDLSVEHLGNARTIYEFFWRQAWHSEGYSSRIKKSIKEPVFVFTLGYLLMLVLIPVTGFKYTFEIIIALVFLVTIRSVDRIRKSKNLKNCKNIINIFAVDLVYFSGRAFGFCKGIFKNGFKL
ncbi:glycosyltransferase [Salinimonas chungwhensis]|uniref:glycosyltransferase n=1 Tax=Salinimonas chungwhensis TaxID=265425 RepID=UPI0003795E11|nr:glycosyltransferase [Salinimonas chungwhensis]